MVPASLQDVEEAGDIAVDIGLRIFQRVAHTGLRRQMRDPVEPLGGEQRGHRLRLPYIDALKRKARMRLQPR